MMTAGALRRLLPDASLRKISDRLADPEDLRAVFGRLTALLCEEGCFKMSEKERGETAARAAGLLPRLASEPRSFDGHDEWQARLGLRSEDWTVRAEAAETISASPRRLDARVLGSLAPDGQAPAVDKGKILDGSAVALALAVAADEAVTPGLAGRQAAWREAWMTAPHERDGVDRWDILTAALAESWVRIGRLSGLPSLEARASAWIAGLILRGRLLGRVAGSDAVLALGAAGRTLLDAEAATETAPVSRWLAHLAETNDRRMEVWGLPGREPSVRALGASVVGVVPAAEAALPPRWLRDAEFLLPGAQAVVRLPESLVAALVRSTVAGAVARLDDLIGDVRCPPEERARIEAFAETLRRHAASAGSSRAAFASIVGWHGRGAPELGEPRDGMRLYEAAPLSPGIPAAAVCRGLRGRPVRCRPMIDVNGAFVGYAAFDAMSEELHGSPAFAFYDRDGKRIGYWPADGPVRLKLGDPEHGYATAPEVVPLPGFSWNRTTA